MSIFTLQHPTRWVAVDKKELSVNAGSFERLSVCQAVALELPQLSLLIRILYWYAIHLILSARRVPRDERKILSYRRKKKKRDTIHNPTSSGLSPKSLKRSNMVLFLCHNNKKEQKVNGKMGLEIHYSIEKHSWFSSGKLHASVFSPPLLFPVLFLVQSCDSRWIWKQNYRPQRGNKNTMVSLAATQEMCFSWQGNVFFIIVYSWNETPFLEEKNVLDEIRPRRI